MATCPVRRLWRSRSVLTDGVSGPDGLGGDGERAKSESVLGSDPEQVVLTFQQTRHHVGLAGAGRIHLMTKRARHQPKTPHSIHESIGIFRAGLS